MRDSPRATEWADPMEHCAPNTTTRVNSGRTKRRIMKLVRRVTSLITGSHSMHRCITLIGRTYSSMQSTRLPIRRSTRMPATLKGMTIGVQGAYDDAVLTQGFPATVTLFGSRGARLPYTSRFSGGLWIDQRFAIGIVTGSVGAVAGY